MNTVVKTTAQTAVGFAVVTVAMNTYTRVQNARAVRELNNAYYATLPATSRRITN